MERNSNLTTFIERLSKIGIKVELLANYPWVYLDRVNGNKVTDKFQANHGFTAFFLTNEGYKITDIREVFKQIRKYK